MNALPGKTGSPLHLQERKVYASPTRLDPATAKTGCLQPTMTLHTSAFRTGLTIRWLSSSRISEALNSRLRKSSHAYQPRSTLFWSRPFRAAPERQRGFRMKPKQWRCRRSEAEPHAPPGLSPQVTGGGQTGIVISTERNLSCHFDRTK